MLNTHSHTKHHCDEVSLLQEHNGFAHPTYRTTFNPTMSIPPVTMSILLLCSSSVRHKTCMHARTHAFIQSLTHSHSVANVFIHSQESLLLVLTRNRIPIHIHIISHSFVVVH